MYIFTQDKTNFLRKKQIDLKKNEVNNDTWTWKKIG